MIRAFVSLVLVASASPALAVQTIQASPTGPRLPITLGQIPCLGARNLNSLPGDANAEHVINADGRYILTAGVPVSAGKSGIRLDPPASHVVIDLNGHTIFDDAAGASLNGIELDYHYTILKIAANGGGTKNLGGSALDISSAAGVIGNGIVMEGCGGTAISAIDVEMLQLTKCVSSEGAGFVSYCGPSITLVDCFDANSSGDGVVVVDTCATFQGVPIQFKAAKHRSSGAGGDAISVTTTQSALKLSMDGGNLGSSGCDGVSISAGGGTTCEVKIDSSSIVGSGEDGVSVSGAGSGGRISCVLRSSNLGSSGCDGVSIAPGGGECDFQIESCAIIDSGEDAVDVSGTGRVRGKLKVSNLGSSGCDGVSIDLGGGGSGDVVLEECIIADSTLNGVRVVMDGHNGGIIKLASSHLAGNGSSGVSATGCSVAMSDSSVRSSTGRGIEVLTGVQCRPHSVVLERVTVESCGSDGIWVESTAGGRLEKCAAIGNVGTGIHVGDVVTGVCATGMVIKKCHAASNVTGYNVLASGGHVVVGNAASLNTTDYSINLNGNVVGPIQTNQAMLATPHPHANLH